MSLIKQFSVTYNLEREKRNKRRSEANSSVGSSFDRIRNKKGLKKETLEAILKLGFEAEAILLLYKVHQFTTLDEALNLLSQDPITKLYNHRFSRLAKATSSFANPSKTQIIYGRVSNGSQDNNSKCDICNANKSNHLDDSYFIGNNKNESPLSQHNNDITSGDVSIKPLIPEPPSLLSSHNNNNSNNNNNDNSIDYNNKSNKQNQEFAFGKIIIPEETLNLFESPDICRICFAEKVNKDNIAQISCAHFFCNTCINIHLTTKITNGIVINIKCLLGGCPKIYTDTEIQCNVSDEIYRKYRKFYNEQIKLNHPDKKYVNCPFPDCEELVDSSFFEDDFFECEQKHIFCYKCHHIGYHKHGKCDNDNILFLQQMKKGSNALNYKQCPKCSVIIEKIDGCNHMKCLNCQFNFCWLCLKKYTNEHFALYNVGGCPGMKFDTETQSRLRRNPFLKCLWYLLSCILGVGLMILIVLFYLFFGCAYEMIKCYQQKKEGRDEEDDDDEDYPSSDIENSQNIDNQAHQNDQQGNQQVKPGQNWKILALLGFLGFLCQPFYLSFILLYGLMECYRRFTCWFGYTF